MHNVVRTATPNYMVFDRVCLCYFNIEILFVPSMGTVMPDTFPYIL